MSEKLTTLGTKDARSVWQGDVHVASLMRMANDTWTICDRDERARLMPGSFPSWKAALKELAAAPPRLAEEAKDEP